MPGNSGTRTECEEPEWVIRQGFACVWVPAPSPEVAIEFAAKRLGHMGAWKVGPGVEQEVFPAEEYRECAGGRLSLPSTMPLRRMTVTDRE